MASALIVVMSALINNFFITLRNLRLGLWSYDENRWGVRS
jgi:hypothetical protein